MGNPDSREFSPKMAESRVQWLKKIRVVHCFLDVDKKTPESSVRKVQTARIENLDAK